MLQLYLYHSAELIKLCYYNTDKLLADPELCNPTWDTYCFITSIGQKQIIQSVNKKAKFPSRILIHNNCSFLKVIP